MALFPILHTRIFSLSCTFRLRLFRRKTFSTVKCLQMQMIYRKIFVFPMFVCILENASENILRCLARRKMKKKKFRNPLLSANPPPQCTVNPPQTTIKKKPQTHRHSKPTNPPSQQTITAKKPQTQQTPQTHKPSCREGHREAQIGEAPVRESQESHHVAQPPRRKAHRAMTRLDLYLSRIGGLGVYRWSSRSVQGSVRRLDGGIGATVGSVLLCNRCSGWLGTGWAREKASRGEKESREEACV
jgi:hypothetical protein